jgi:hypothetical protein
MTTRTITKLEAAQRQLTTAIRMFFADGDPVAVHTLACPAREIYEKHCRKAGQGRMFDLLQAGNRGRAEKELWNLLNAARNLFKHEGDSLDQSIEFDDTMNDFAILSACTDCATLCSLNQPVEVQAFSRFGLSRVVCSAGTASFLCQNKAGAAASIVRPHRRFNDPPLLRRLVGVKRRSCEQHQFDCPNPSATSATDFAVPHNDPPNVVG